MKSFLFVVIGSSIGCAFGFYITSISYGQPDSPKLIIMAFDRTTKKTAEVNFKSVNFDKPTKDTNTDFILNGSNKTSSIKNLPTIAGKTIADLELQMRPGASGPSGSAAGFLGADESLLKVLAHDNRTVVEKYQLTHQQLAAPFLILSKLRASKKSGTLKFQDANFHITEFRSSNGYQHSPFGDELKACEELTLFNTATSQKLSFSTLVPEMIFRYGFYEGEGTRYRIAPQRIIDFFGRDLLSSIKIPE